MTGSKFKIALKTSLIAALIAAMLAVSGGAVNASANSTSSPSETVTAETNGGTLTLGSYREAGKLYASASPVTYNGSFRSEIESDRIALMIYDSLYDHSITNPDNNDYTLPVDPSYMDGDGSDLDKTQQSVFKSVALGNTAFNYDHPEAFWVGLSGCSASASSTDGETYAVTSVTVRRVETYTGAFNQRSTVTTGINTAVNAISAGETRYDTLKNIHDYVCNNSVYDDDEAKYSNTPEAHTAAPLFNGKGTYVCEGYAKAFKILCDKYNIPCVLVCGTGTTKNLSQNYF